MREVFSRSGAATLREKPFLIWYEAGFFNTWLS